MAGKKCNGWMDFSQDFFDKDTQLVVAAAAAEKRINPNSPCCYSAMVGRDSIIYSHDGISGGEERLPSSREVGPFWVGNLAECCPFQ